LAARRKILILSLWLILGTPQIWSADDILIHIHLFRGVWPEGHAGLANVAVWASSSEPRIAGLRSKIDSPSAELTAAVIEMLVDSKGLKSVDDYFAFSERWNGRLGNFTRDIEHKSYHFKFGYTPKRLSPQALELKLSLLKTPDNTESSGTGGRMDRLLDARLKLAYDDPVIVGIPYKNDAFFMLIFATGTEAPREARKDLDRGSEKKSSTITPPKGISTLIPAYPEELRKQGVQGEVGLQVAIDDKGTVTAVRVARPLHPYLDFAAVQAVRQWTFEPAMKDAKPVPYIANITLVFDPERYRLYEEEAERAGERAGDGPAKGPDISRMLEGAALYCEKLETAALEFICEEKIDETHYNFATDPKWGGIAVASRETGQITRQAFFPQWDPHRTIRSNYMCDYLFVRRDNRVDERRVVLEDNGKRMPDRSVLLEEKRFTALNPVMGAVELLGRGRQALFNYRIIGRAAHQERDVAILEVIPKSGNSRGIEYAKVWIDSENFQILRSEVQGVPIEGYDDVLRDSVEFRVRPYLLATHTYDFEKNGIRFPGQSIIRVEYPRRGEFTEDRTLKLKIDMKYGKYQFFTVETDGGIKK
jgi:TonB family protein